MADNDNVIKIETKAPSWVANVASTISQRISSSLFGISKNGKRNINEIFGYTVNLSFNQMYWMWRRGGIAHRIVSSISRSCWRDGIVLKDDDDNEVLVDEMKVLIKKGKFLRRLEQADILNRIGRFSVLFVGLPDGLTPDKPLGKVNGERLNEVYFRPYAEDGIIIKSWDKDPFSSRFGMPEIYTLQVENRGEKDVEIISQPIDVHFSRLVHMAEGSLDSDVEGLSALEPIFNTLEDIVKTSGGAAEAFFRNARNRFSMETDPKYASSFTPDQKAQLEEEALRFQNEWQDFIRAGGINIKALNIPHHDPMPTFMTQIKVIAGATGLSMRVLIGEGAGQYAGNEDKESFNQIVQDRRDMWCSEWVMDVLDILSEAGMLKIEDNYSVGWGTVETISEKEKSVSARDKATALNQLAAAISQPAVDGRLELEDAMEIVFGDDVLADIVLGEGNDDGLSDDELADADLADQNIGDEKEPLPDAS